MLADVLSALARTHSLAGIMVITGDAAAAAMAQASGAFVLADAGNAGRPRGNSGGTASRGGGEGRHARDSG